MEKVDPDGANEEGEASPLAAKTWTSMLVVHRISAWLLALPLGLILLTGVMLQIKPWATWIQPPEVKGSGGEPRIELTHIVEAARTVAAAQVREWRDIRAIDIKPAKGIARVKTVSDYEMSIDLRTGEVLQAGPSRSHFLLELHKGSYFGDGGRYGIFLPTAILALGLWLSGVVLMLIRRRWF